MKTLIFDLDGTLADTSGDLIESANVCFREMGHGDVLDPKSDAATAMMGGGRAMLQLGFDRLGSKVADAEIAAYYPILLEAYETNIDRHTFLYPGCYSAIERALASGCLVGVCTNKPERLADVLLTRLGIRELFKTLIGADTLPVRKPHPDPLLAAISQLNGDPSQSILFGDSPTDRETARAADVASVLVTFGPTGSEVEKLQPHGLLHHYDQLDQLVEEVLG